MRRGLASQQTRRSDPTPARSGGATYMIDGGPVLYIPGRTDATVTFEGGTLLICVFEHASTVHGDTVVSMGSDLSVACVGIHTTRPGCESTTTTVCSGRIYPHTQCLTAHTYTQCLTAHTHTHTLLHFSAVQRRTGSAAHCLSGRWRRALATRGRVLSERAASQLATPT